jgi:hypothetical protein
MILLILMFVTKQHLIQSTFDMHIMYNKLSALLEKSLFNNTRGYNNIQFTYS